MCRLSAFVEAHSAVLPYMLPLPRFFNLGVGEAGPKNLGEAENCILTSKVSKMIIWQIQYFGIQARSWVRLPKGRPGPKVLQTFSMKLEES